MKILQGTTYRDLDASISLDPCICSSLHHYYTSLLQPNHSQCLYSSLYHDESQERLASVRGHRETQDALHYRASVQTRIH